MATVLTEPKSTHTPIKQTRILINNKWLDSVSGKTFATINPATGEPLPGRRGRQGRRRSRRQGRPQGLRGRPLARMTASERGRLLNKLADLIEKNKEELAALESLDNGKPYRTALAADLPLTIKCYRYYAGWADKIHGKTIPSRATTSATPGTSRSASSARSSRGTSRC